MALKLRNISERMAMPEEVAELCETIRILRSNVRLIHGSCSNIREAREIAYEALKITKRIGVPIEQDWVLSHARTALEEAS